MKWSIPDPIFLMVWDEINLWVTQLEGKPDFRVLRLSIFCDDEDPGDAGAQRQGRLWAAHRPREPMAAGSYTHRNFNIHCL